MDEFKKLVRAVRCPADPAPDNAAARAPGAGGIPALGSMHCRDLSSKFVEEGKGVRIKDSTTLVEDDDDVEGIGGFAGVRSMSSAWGAGGKIRRRLVINGFCCCCCFPFGVITGDNDDGNNTGIVAVSESRNVDGSAGGIGSDCGGMVVVVIWGDGSRRSRG